MIVQCADCTGVSGTCLIGEINAQGVRVNLEVDDQGQANWVFGNFAGDLDGAEPESADSKGHLPFLIDKVDIKGLSVSLVHPALEEKLIIYAGYLDGTRFESGALDMAPDLRATDIALLARGSSLSVFGELNQRPLYNDRL